jgi:hypothetical protein
MTKGQSKFGEVPSTTDSSTHIDFEICNVNGLGVERAYYITKDIVRVDIMLMNLCNHLLASLRSTSTNPDFTTTSPRPSKQRSSSPLSRHSFVHSQSPSSTSILSSRSQPPLSPSSLASASPSSLNHNVIKLQYKSDPLHLSASPSTSMPGRTKSHSCTPANGTPNSKSTLEQTLESCTVTLLGGARGLYIKLALTEYDQQEKVREEQNKGEEVKFPLIIEVITPGDEEKLSRGKDNLPKNKVRGMFLKALARVHNSTGGLSARGEEERREVRLAELAQMRTENMQEICGVLVRQHAPIDPFQTDGQS